MSRLFGYWSIKSVQTEVRPNQSIIRTFYVVRNSRQIDAESEQIWTGGSSYEQNLFEYNWFSDTNLPASGRLPTGPSWWYSAYCPASTPHLQQEWARRGTRITWGTTKMSEKMMAASKSKRRIGWSVTSQASSGVWQTFKQCSGSESRPAPIHHYFVSRVRIRNVS